MSFVLVTTDGILEIQSEPTGEMIETVLAGEATDVGVRGSERMCVYCNRQEMLDRKNVNPVMTVFCREQGYIGPDREIHGRGALVCDEEHRGLHGIPDRHMHRLAELAQETLQGRVAAAGGVN